MTLGEPHTSKYACGNMNQGLYPPRYSADGFHLESILTYLNRLEIFLDNKRPGPDEWHAGKPDPGVPTYPSPTGLL